MELDGDIKYRIRNEVETHVFPEMEGHEFFVCLSVVGKATVKKATVEKRR